VESVSSALQMEVDDIISYHDVVTAEKASPQKGINHA
jgi:hypothetical protein